ncbi:MAG: NAD(P)-dependent oxidoreductase [Bacteroidales bacterium]|jgi:nucleoside-diphosphate-sugar epimerase
MKILLTGATGFIGSYIADELFLKGYELMLTKRSSSNLKNCELFKDKVKWVDTDCGDWILKTVEFMPDIIIHSAWIGVEAKDRDDYEMQRKNIDFVDKLISIAEKTKPIKFIGFGSQAEYGYLDSVVSEEKECKPDFAYGKVKLEVLDKIKSFCEGKGISWYWLRVFAVRGEREGQNWLLPSFERKMKDMNETSMDFTLGEQKYAYLDVKVAASYVGKIVEKENGKNGIYNISAEGANSIRDILTDIRDRLRPDFVLNFGALPTRPNQSSIIEGKMDKFFKEFGRSN